MIVKFVTNYLLILLTILIVIVKILPGSKERGVLHSCHLKPKITSGPCHVRFGSGHKLSRMRAPREAVSNKFDKNRSVLTAPERSLPLLCPGFLRGALFW